MIDVISGIGINIELKIEGKGITFIDIDCLYGDALY